MRRLLAVAAAIALLAACTDDDPASDEASSTTTTADDGTTSSTEAPPDPVLDSIELGIVEIVELEEPVAMAARPGSPDLYIAEQSGRVRLVLVEEDEFGEDEGELSYELQTTPLLDITDDVLADQSERGLLGIAFSSDGRKLYVDYTRKPDGATVIEEYTLGDSKRIDRDSRRELLVVEQPFPNHNGGQLATGPDGYLYISLGDGGSHSDPMGHAEDVTTLLGSILRIDPESGAEDGPAYGIPPGNPIGEGSGDRAIWLYGVRNPWRFSFDTVTGDLWVADVGQNLYEEINWLPSVGGFDAGKGDNLGWPEMEATHSYDGGENPEGGVLPIFEYGRDQGCSVIGGYVYRGEEIPDLQGVYLYADFCGTGVSGLQVDGATVIDTRTWDLPLEQVYSLGEGDDGELYVLLAGGRVVKLVTPEAAAAADPEADADPEE